MCNKALHRLVYDPVFGLFHLGIVCKKLEKRGLYFDRDGMWKMVWKAREAHEWSALPVFPE